jgi:iron complex transport system substrate-binding protein
MDETCVPTNPQRVINLHDAANTVALGVKPVAGVFRGGFEFLLGERIRDIEQLPVGDLSLETVTALNPDLILATSYRQPIYHQLTQIAPAVLVSWKTGSDWKKVFFKEAEALGRVDKAQRLIADYEVRLEQFKAGMGDRLQHTQVSIIRVTAEGVAPYWSDSFCGSILKDAGLRQAPELKGYGDWLISKEQMSHLDADAIFVWTYGHEEAIRLEAQTALERLRKDPLWLTLSAVQLGKVYEVPSYWIGHSILAANAVLDDLFIYLFNERKEHD